MSPVIRVSDETYERLKEWADAWETQDQTIRRVLDAAGNLSPTPSAAAVAHGSPALGSEDTWFRSKSEVARDLYARLRERVNEVGDDIKIGTTPQYVKFIVSGHNFAEVAARSRGLLLVVHSNGYGLQYGQESTWDGLQVKRRSAKAANTLDVEVEVGPDTDFDAIVRTLLKSYETIKLRHAHA